MGVIIFNGVSSQDYGIQVEHPPEYEIPERDYNIIPVPGRSGDVVIDNGCYKNVNRSYDIAIGSLNEDFTIMANKISRWLHSASGYVRLEDSYEPDYYKMAMCSEGNIIQNILQHAGRTTIIFNRKPQRFLKTGDSKIVVANNQKVTNPTSFEALPIITVKGSGAGVLTVGGYTVNITSITNFIDLNSENEEAYNGGINLNDYVSLVNGFPKLVPGDTTISFSGGITSVEVVPKWWTI